MLKTDNIYIVEYKLLQIVSKLIIDSGVVCFSSLKTVCLFDFAISWDT